MDNREHNRRVLARYSLTQLTSMVDQCGSDVSKALSRGDEKAAKEAAWKSRVIKAEIKYRLRGE